MTLPMAVIDTAANTQPLPQEIPTPDLSNHEFSDLATDTEFTEMFEGMEMFLNEHPMELSDSGHRDCVTGSSHSSCSTNGANKTIWSTT